MSDVRIPYGQSRGRRFESHLLHGGNLYEHSKLFSGTYDIDSIINVQETFIDEFIKRKQKHE